MMADALDPKIKAALGCEATMVVLRSATRTKMALESVAAAIEWAKENRDGVIDAQILVHDGHNTVIKWPEIKLAFQAVG